MIKQHPPRTSTTSVDDKIKTKVKELGYYHKIGVLLYGIEGTGKSTILKKYYTDAIEKNNAIVFHINTYGYFMQCWEFIMDIRKIQDNPFIIIFEEMDSMFSIDGNESKLKKLWTDQCQLTIPFI